MSTHIIGTPIGKANVLLLVDQNALNFHQRILE